MNLLSMTSSLPTKKLLNQTGPIQDLVHKVVGSVRKNLQLDRTKKEDARIFIRLKVKKELRGKMPFSELDNIRGFKNQIMNFS